MTPYPYREIADRIAEDIRSGMLEPGERLPSARVLAQDWGVNKLTAHHAYQVLKAEGLVRTEGQSGTFVADPPAQDGVLTATLADVLVESVAVLAERVRATEDRLTAVEAKL